MKLRQLGSSDIQIAPIIFGGNVFGWTINEKKSFELLDAFLDAGFNCVDTADVYSGWIPGNKGGESETIIGNWLKQRNNRSKVIVATKVGMEFRGEKGLKREHIIKSVEGSLKRLQTDYIDLYQAHQDDFDTPLEESLEAFDQLQKSGKVRIIGASNYSGQRLAEALETSQKLKLSQYQSLQPRYNLYDRKEFEQDLEEVCKKNHLSVITYFSLASGFLSGKYRSEQDASKSARGEGVKANYLNERGYKILEALDQVSEELSATPSQVSLAWLLHRPVITAPIVSSTKIEQLKDILKASEISLNDELTKKLNNASSWT